MIPTQGPGWAERSPSQKTPAPKQVALDPDVARELTYQEKRAASYARLENALKYLALQESQAQRLRRGRE